ncbi:MAG: tellurite resistance TerB family protein [Pseudomonadota bacterium]|nr:tellurite resistance TerB family protein [Pseudomonadota bacterium]
MGSGAQAGGAPEASGGGGSLSDLFNSLGKMAGGAQTDNTPDAGGSEGSLGDLLGSLGKMAGGAQADTAAPQGGQQAETGGALGDLLGNLGNNKAALGGLGALAGALLGGGGKSVGGAMGGGALAMLASMAMSALKNAGEKPSQPPQALTEPQTRDDKLVLENDAETIVKAMINAAKADGKIDNAEIQKIVGKLDDDGLSQQEKDFFISEANKPLNINGVIASAGNKPEMAAQIYAASLLAIEVDTAAEQRYMQQLASGLRLHPRVTAHIERTLGMA